MTDPPTDPQPTHAPRGDPHPTDTHPTDTQPAGPRIVDLRPQPTVAVWVQRPMADLDVGALLDRHLPDFFGQLSDHGEDPAGAPYAQYFEFGPDRADIELGVPVAVPVTSLRRLADCEPGQVGASELPGGRPRISCTAGRTISWAARTAGCATGSTSRAGTTAAVRGSRT